MKNVYISFNKEGKNEKNENKDNEDDFDFVDEEQPKANLNVQANKKNFDNYHKTFQTNNQQSTPPTINPTQIYNQFLDSYKNKYIQSSLIHNTSIISDIDQKISKRHNLPSFCPNFLSNKNLDNDINIKKLIESGILPESKFEIEIKNLDIGELVKISREPEKVVKYEKKFREMCRKISKKTIKSLYVQFIDLSTYFVNFFGLKNYFDLFEDNITFNNVTETKKEIIKQDELPKEEIIIESITKDVIQVHNKIDEILNDDKKEDNDNFDFINEEVINENNCNNSNIIKENMNENTITPEHKKENYKMYNNGQNSIQHDQKNLFINIES